MDAAGLTLEERRKRYDNRAAIGGFTIWIVPILAYLTFGIVSATQAHQPIGLGYIIICLIIGFFVGLLPSLILAAIFLAILRHNADDELKSVLKKRDKEREKEAERERARKKRDDEIRRDPAGYEKRQRMDGYVAEARQLLAKPLSPLSSVAFRTKPGEAVYWTEPCELHMMTKVVSREGFVPGMSLRVARGFWLRTPSSHVATIVSMENQKKDAGTIFISDQRVLFVGMLETIEVQLEKIVSIDPFADGVRISVLNGKTRCFVTGNPRATAVLARVLEGTHGERVSASDSAPEPQALPRET